MDGRIFHIKSELSQNVAHSWSVDEMASLVQLSVPHFQRLFRQIVGTSPMSYLRELRLNNAHSLLSDTNNFLQIKEIGVVCGLSNDSHFTRDFKKKYGLTPTQLRAEVWQIHQANLPDGRD